MRSRLTTVLTSLRVSTSEITARMGQRVKASVGISSYHSAPCANTAGAIGRITFGAAQPVGIDGDPNYVPVVGIAVTCWVGDRLAGIAALAKVAPRARATERGAYTSNVLGVAVPLAITTTLLAPTDEACRDAQGRHDSAYYFGVRSH